MKKNRFLIVSSLLLKRNKFGFLLLIATLFSPFYTFGQSYFYFEIKIPQSDSTLLSYYTFLTLQPDGSAIARIRSASNTLEEQTMADSVLGEQVHDSDLKFLVPVGEPIVFGIENNPPINIRFVFKKQIDSAGSYYTPFQAAYKDSNGKWNASEMVFNQEKSYGELLQEKEFVSFFFTEDDPFFKYLYAERDRANTGIIRKEKLFLILVANTNDSKIGVTSKKDFDEISQTFVTLTDNLGMQLLATKISGSDFNAQNITRAITNLKKQKPSPIDIVVFYYSGHGFRYSNDTSRYPRMSLRTNTDQDIGTNNMAVEAVYNEIVQLGARVNLVLADCCNQDIGVPVPIGRDVLKTRFGGYNTTSQSLNMANCNALFFSKQPISIIASSAEVKQLATGNPALGGFFSYYFKAALDKSLYSFWKSDSWLQLLLETKEKARKQALSAECGAGRCTQLAEIKVTPPR